MRFLPLLVPAFLCSLAAALTYKGADISSVAIVEGQGVHYTDAGATKAFEKIIVSHGANTARIRVWTAGDYNTNYAIAMAKRVKAAGMTLIVDLHYSDTWADPGHQAIPAAWPKDLAGLNTQIYKYTNSIVKQFASSGAAIDILQVGNEINDGLLWPVGRISVNGFSGASQLLHSAVQGANDAGVSKILLHLANGWDSTGLQFFFNGIFIQGALSLNQLSIIGVSFYPFYDAGATLSALKSSLTTLAGKLAKPIIVAETDWPEACSGVSLTEPSIAVSAAGQETWIKDIKSVLSGLPNGLLNLCSLLGTWLDRKCGVGIWLLGGSFVSYFRQTTVLTLIFQDNLVVNSNGATRTSINIFKDM
ncbi:arabinogalactan endo-1,4-beta-galactosidase [Amylostereum chailletii]|nr:arabinogalactan endo-1,4-beta-galactosidase [Amylostereum chailletii]